MRDVVERRFAKAVGDMVEVQRLLTIGIVHRRHYPRSGLELGASIRIPV